MPPQPATAIDDTVPMYDFSILRTLRKREGWTIGHVSEASGISAAVISRLERNQSTAELETLYRLARAFGMSATDLLSLAESKIAHRTEETGYHSHTFHFRKITYGNVSCFLATAAEGAHVSRKEIHHDDYETCWVIEGRVRLALPHQQVVLSAGEAIQFDAIQEHTYEALDDSRMIVVHLRKQLRF